MNAVNWFEIAVTDIERAKKFYEGVLKCEFEYMEMGDTKMYMFKGNPEDAGALGCIFQSENVAPSAAGTTVYFACEDCSVESGRATENGGSVVFPKMAIGENGFISHVMDTEGNRIGLHSRV